MGWQGFFCGASSALFTTSCAGVVGRPAGCSRHRRHRVQRSACLATLRCTISCTKIRNPAKHAVQERYKLSPFLRLLTRSLQFVALRPLPCNYYAIQPVSALSRRRRGFKSKRKTGSISQMSRRGQRPRVQAIPPVGKPVLSTCDDVNEIAATFSVRQ